MSARSQEASVEAVLDEVDRLRAKCEQLRVRLEERTADWKMALGERDEKNQQAHDAAHVALLAGADEHVLLGCGCDQCERVFKGMVEAGLIAGEWS